MTERIRAAFDAVHADEALKQRTRDYLAKAVYQKKRRAIPAGRVIPALAACLLLVVCLGGSYLYFTPTAFISVDINPSLELGINRFDRVVSVEAYNEDGQELTDALDVKYLDYRDALEVIVSDQAMEAYLQDGILSLTVAGESERQCGEIYQAMEDCASGRQNIRCHTSSADTAEEAHHSGMSVGKYQAYLTLRELNPDITAEEVQDMTMREIYQLIRAYGQDGGAFPDPDTSGGGYGHGHGNGKHHGGG